MLRDAIASHGRPAARPTYFCSVAEYAQNGETPRSSIRHDQAVMRTPDHSGEVNWTLRTQVRLGHAG
ncbi:hypothetical protein PsYK624_153670 [Phanerochaete sordida]|uniref:Uncharacterized protein n=1 Tax=Phanerochaete sordida TaxID=48140 RepID=A0A9P3GQQ8_9APHY|nr:hypothetical protein PsYK624_153670 [Phanerochaete sordida]